MKIHYDRAVFVAGLLKNIPPNVAYNAFYRERGEIMQWAHETKRNKQV